MKYASEVGLTTSVHEWKPCSPEMFASGLHRAQAEVCDEFGNEGITAKTARLDRDTIATVWYRRKAVGSPISQPILMSITGGSNPFAGRPILFSHIENGHLIGIRPAMPSSANE